MRDREGGGKWEDRKKNTEKENQLALKFGSHSAVYSQNVQNSPPLGPILASLVQSPHSHYTSMRKILILSSDLNFGLPRNLFPLSFRKNMYFFPLVLHVPPISQFL
jgi:hypothetical protein